MHLADKALEAGRDFLHSQDLEKRVRVKPNADVGFGQDGTAFIDCVLILKKEEWDVQPPRV